MQILLTADQRRMLEELARKQRRSMNSVVGLAIERVFMQDLLRADSAGAARAKGSATGRSE